MPKIKQKTKKGLKEEGIVLNKWMFNRFKKNKNILLAITGPTGSGKSYSNLRICELWYQYKFGETFPVKTHCCFSIEEIIRILNSGELRRGELLVLEEAGVNLNSLEFQSKISKLFNFVLQSFRSMNVGILMNLPVLSMLNKSARLLLHGQFITNGIDHQKKCVKLKPLFHQLNQQTGKIYTKFIRIIVDGETIPIEKFNYYLPSDELVEEYEEKKHNFVTNLTKGFVNELDQQRLASDRRKEPTDIQKETMRALVNCKANNRFTKVGEQLGKSQSAVTMTAKAVKKQGWTEEDFMKGGIWAEKK